MNLLELLRVAALPPLLVGLFGPAAIADDALNHRRNVTVLLSDFQGEPLGSAVVVAESIDGYWLATNHHVVQERNRLCVNSSDLQPELALRVPLSGAKPAQALDIAILWMPAHTDRGTGKQRAVARFAPFPPNAKDFPLVVASGYPSPTEANRTWPKYKEARGLLLPLLSNPLQGGFDLSSTAAVQKGMSGGGLFLGNHLIGINGTHAEPLWPGILLGETGKPIDPGFNDQLEAVSLAISAPVIRQILNTVEMPSRKQVNSLSRITCVKRD